MRPALALLALAGAALAVSAPASAQDRGYGRPDSTPRGSYQDSCRDITVRRGEISAQCRDNRNQWVWTSANADCRGDMTNQNGRLVCLSGGGRPGTLPRGSYLESCRDAAVRGRELTAQCRNDRGRWNWTSADADCRGDMTNQDGRLVCYGGGGHPGQGGGWRGGVVLYQDGGFRERSVEINGDTPDLRAFNFNDRASSIRVQGGDWELCDDINYGGRCWRVSSDIVQFSPDMNERVSSLRRIR
ncbi:beta/gamma crystallin-related protein [Caulobacter hibisci]|uniref:Beta/gamma crystallin family protein n=1 Tax=Caulobacter hibisci TaxID=2035993 RepID=A0ABS0T139_9CAUL|nr:beta/gamma crystallin-related protein [Caulobacter hibisci]MBI1685231.1 beta/gamma crystallin family protein [Caulobacter hibisci]